MRLNAQVIEKMQSVNLDAVDKETLVDASGFVFDNSLPLEKRAARMLEQLKNPYCFRYGDMAIKLEFAEDGPSLQELLTGFFLRQKSPSAVPGVTIRHFQTRCPEVESSLLYPRCRGII